jgi:hypothetical protein
MALAVVKCTRCGAVTPNSEVLRKREWLLPCPPPCDGERVILEVNEHVEDRRWRRRRISHERRRPLPV